MKLALILPPDALSVSHTMRTSCHMVLAQYCTDQAYIDAYRYKHDVGDFTILDNGIGEGVSMPFADVLEVAKQVKADEIVMPDVIGDGPATVEAVRSTRHLVPKVMRAVCPHGKDWDEWEECLCQLVGLGAHTICIGRYDNLPGGRIPGLRIIERNQWHWDHHIHMLGCAYPPVRSIITELNAGPWIRSMDTGAPIAYAQEDRIIDNGPHASLKWGAPFELRYALQNVSILLTACKGA